MINAIVQHNTAKEPDVPLLMEHKAVSGTIAIFTNDNKLIMLAMSAACTNNVYLPGNDVTHYIQYFKEFNGSITLTNK